MCKIAKILFPVLLFTASNASAGDPDIIVEGLTEEQESNVSAFLSLSQETCQSPNWRISSLFTKSDKEINKALRALGYYDSKISKKLSFKDDCWQASFTIAAGKPVRVNKLLVQIKGEAELDPIFQKLLASLPIKRGDILNHALYEKIKQDLRSLAMDYGYLNNQLIKKSLQVNPEKKQASIEIVFDSGPRHQFGEITINQDILNPDFIQRYVRIKSDEFYSTKKLAKTYNAFSESIYFSNVEIKPDMEERDDNKVPIQITLTPEKKHDFSIGGGYDTDIGPLASFGYRNRRLNRSGHHFSFDLDLSPVLSSAEALYMIPFAQPPTDYFSIGLGYKYEQPDTFESEEAKLSFQHHHLYQNKVQQVLFLDLSYETFTISDVSQSTLLLVPGARWQYTKTNNILRPTKGYHLNFALAAAPESLISDVRFLQAKFIAKLIAPIPWYARFITRVNLGATLTDDFNRLPTSYRFYAGGTETVRGYDYKNIGPTDEKGIVIGGKYLSVVSAEYEQFINESWGVAAFVDAGNAFNEDSFEIKMGAGLGIRWASPIGPIRLDFAVPLNDSDSSFQFHFAAGTQL